MPDAEPSSSENSGRLLQRITFTLLRPNSVGTLRQCSEPLADVTQISICCIADFSRQAHEQLRASLSPSGLLPSSRINSAIQQVGNLRYLAAHLISTVASARCTVSVVRDTGPSSPQTKAGCPAQLRCRLLDCGATSL